MAGGGHVVEEENGEGGEGVHRQPEDGQGVCHSNELWAEQGHAALLRGDSSDTGGPRGKTPWGPPTHPAQHGQIYDNKVIFG